MSVFEWEYWWTSSGQVIAVGQASETDTALTVAPIHKASVAQTTETDSASVVGSRQIAAVGQVIETDSAVLVKPYDIINEGVALEADSTADVKPVHIIGASQTNEVDTAQVITPKHVVLVNQAGEVDSGPSAGSLHVIPVGLTNENITALDVTPILSGPIVVTVDVATESDTALEIAPPAGTFSWAQYGGRGLHNQRPKPPQKRTTKYVKVDVADEFDFALDCKPEQPLYVEDIVKQAPAPIKPKPVRPAKIVQAVTIGIAESDEIFQETVLELELMGVI